MADIFLSYAREDEERVAALVAAFEERGWSVFWDRHIPAGQSWRSHIGQALHEAKCVVVVWSRRSVASRWVIEEAEEGQQRGNLVPVLLDDAQVPIGFRGVQAGDLRDWRPDRPSPQFAQLLRDIEALLRAGSSAPVDGATGKTAAAVHGARPDASPARTKKVRSGWLARSIAMVALLAIAGAGYWGYESTRSTSSSHTGGERSGKSGAGKVKSATGTFEFDRISGMSMGVGKLTITQFGSRVDLPLAKIARVRFLPGSTVKIDYVDGKSEEAELACYWNAPVTFHVGEKELYYGDCTALQAIQEIEFFH